MLLNKIGSSAMPLTSYIAQLFGIYIALMGIVMLVKREAMLQIMTDIVDQRPLIFILAMFRGLIGLAIVLAHNNWSGPLTIIVTLIGWITFLRGIALLLLPADAERKVLGLFKREATYYGASIVAIALGLGLSYAGFTT
jgi:hypothetical protein